MLFDTMSVMGRIYSVHVFVVLGRVPERDSVKKLCLSPHELHWNFIIFGPAKTHIQP